MLNSLWALDEVSTADGGPRIIPGTHNRPELPEDAFDDVLAPHPDEIIWEASAGSVLIFNAHTWHGAPTTIPERVAGSTTDISLLGRIHSRISENGLQTSRVPV